MVSDLRSDEAPYVRTLFNESYDALQSVNACPGIPFVVTSFCVNGYYELGFFASKPLKSSLELSKGYVIEDTFLPAAENMASYVFSGKSSELNVAYGRMVNWFEANGLQFTYPSRELYMHSSREGDDSNFIVEIQMPIATRD
jgi:effector-binding domain-containing protein